MSTTIKVNLDSVNTILAKRGLEKGGRSQQVLASEVWRLSDPYTPFDNGILKSNVSISLDGTQIIYNAPYAKRMWYGKVMVGNPLKATDKDISFKDSPMRGPFWTKRMIADRGEDLVKAVAKECGGKAE